MSHKIQFHKEDIDHQWWGEVERRKKQLPPISTSAVPLKTAQDNPKQLSSSGFPRNSAVFVALAWDRKQGLLSPFNPPPLSAHLWTALKVHEVHASEPITNFCSRTTNRQKIFALWVLLHSLIHTPPPQYQSCWEVRIINVVIPLYNSMQVQEWTIWNWSIDNEVLWPRETSLSVITI